MQGIPLHPMLVHLPMALAVLMPLLSGGLLLALWRGWLPKRAWGIAVAGQALLLVGGLASMRTGESDEELVERVVPESAVEAHEEAAEAFVWASGLVLVTALAGLFGPSRLARSAGLVTAAGSLVVLGLGVRVGSAGGSLVYEHGAGAAHSTLPAGVPAWTTRAEHDDD